MHLPGRPLGLVFGQVVLFDIGTVRHQKVLGAAEVDELKGRTEAVRAEVGLLIRHLVEVVNRNHLEDLHVSGVLLPRVGAVRVIEIGILPLISLKGVLQGELVILLDMIDIARVRLHLSSRIAFGAKKAQVTADFLVVFRQALCDIDAELAEGKSPVHVINLPIAL